MSGAIEPGDKEGRQHWERAGYQRDNRGGQQRGIVDQQQVDRRGEVQYRSRQDDDRGQHDYTPGRDEGRGGWLTHRRSQDPHGSLYEQPDADVEHEHAEERDAASVRRPAQLRSIARNGRGQASYVATDELAIAAELPQEPVDLARPTLLRRASHESHGATVQFPELHADLSPILHETWPTTLDEPWLEAALLQTVT